MSTAPITTEGRIFVAQMMRDMRAREKLGAGLLSPGTTKWSEALRAFGTNMIGCGGPVHAGKLFAAGREKLRIAQHEHNACMLNFFMNRKRSGLFQVPWSPMKSCAREDGGDAVAPRDRSLQRLAERPSWPAPASYSMKGKVSGTWSDTSAKQIAFTIRRTPTGSPTSASRPRQKPSGIEESVTVRARSPSLDRGVTFRLLQHPKQRSKRRRRQSRASLQSPEKAGEALLGNDLAGELNVGPDRLPGLGRPTQRHVPCVRARPVGSPDRAARHIATPLATSTSRSLLPACCGSWSC